MTEIKESNSSQDTKKSIWERMLSKRFLNLNMAVINKVLVSIILLIGVYYLTIINDLTVKGFELQELKQAVNQSSALSREAELKIIFLESLSNISARADKFNMVAVGEIDYVTIIDGIVAKK